MQDLFVILTDTFHKPGFKLQVPRRAGSAAVPPSTQAHTLRTSIPDPARRIIMWAKRDLRCRSPQPAHASVTTVIGAVALWHA